jgi:hypothetical protein
MPNIPNISIIAPSPPSQQSLQPTFVWPSVFGDTLSAPDLGNWWNRYNVRNDKQEDEQNCTVGIECFQKALISAQQRVLILDPHMPGTLIGLLVQAMRQSSVQELLLLFGSPKRPGSKVAKQLGDIRSARQFQLPKGRPAGSVSWRSLKDYAHDRLAVIDGQFWHFGGTVGGFQTGITGASYGWDAQKTRAEDLFMQLWKSAGES